MDARRRGLSARGVVVNGSPRRNLGKWVACGDTFALIGQNGGITPQLLFDWSITPGFLQAPTSVEPPMQYLTANTAFARGGYIVSHPDYGIYVWRRLGPDPRHWQIVSLYGLQCTPADPYLVTEVQTQGVTAELDGSTLLVGGTSDPDVVNGGGAVNVYDFDGSTFILRQKILTPVNTPCSGFGRSLALLGDTMVVGAYGDAEYGRIGIGQTCLGNGHSGFAAVYHRSIVNGQPHWDLVTILRKPIGGPGEIDGFGASVALTPTRIAVGAYLDGRFGLNAGAVYIYQLQNGVWVSSSVLGITDSDGSHLGYKLEFNGNDLLVSAPFFGGSDNFGAVFVFGPCSQVPDPSTGPHCIPGIYGIYVYLSSWFGGDRYADYDRDGYVTVQDLFAYFNDWMAGCP